MQATGRYRSKRRTVGKPWLFKPEEGAICILPDLNRRCPAVDPDDHHLNQPVEVSALRPEFAQFLGIGDRRPDLVVRIGRGPEMPRSLRRPVEQVIV